MVVCSDRLLAFLLGPIAFADAQPVQNPLSKTWNWCVNSRVSGETPPAEEDDPPQEALRPPVKATTGPPVKATTGNRLIVSGFVVLGVLQVVGLIRAASQLQEQSARTQLLHRPDLFHRSDLPVAVAGWSQVKYATVQFDPTRKMGAFSQSWGYRWNQCECVLSADYPFGWGHNLSVCYVGNGWSIMDRLERRPAAGPRPQPELYVEVDMLGPGGEHGLLLYSLVDPAGHVVDVPQHLTWQRISGKAAYSPLWSRVLPAQTFQVQAFVSSRDPLSDAQRLAVHEFYLVARQKLLSTYNTLQRQVGDEQRR